MHLLRGDVSLSVKKKRFGKVTKLFSKIMDPGARIAFGVLLVLLRKRKFSKIVNPGARIVLRFSLAFLKERLVF